MVTEAVDGQRLNWTQVAVAAGLSAATTLIGYGLGSVSRLKGSSNRPFGSLMMEGAAESSFAGNGRSWEQTKRYIEDEKNFYHRVEEADMDLYQMESLDRQTIENNSFINTFTPDEWLFIANSRKEINVPYFASDVARYQYETISAKHHFFGQMPKRIIREGVANADTLRMTKGKAGQELIHVFFSDT